MYFTAAWLSDGRVQAWRSFGDAVHTSWQTQVSDPQSYTPWHVDRETQLAVPPERPRTDGLASMSSALAGRTQVWAVNAIDAQFKTAWKASNDPNSAWIGGRDFVGEISGGGGSAKSITAGFNGHRLWMLANFPPTEGLNLYRTQKTDPSNPASPWTRAARVMVPGGRGVGRLLAAAHLSDGREQIWGITGMREIASTWEVGEPNSGSWAPWEIWEIPGGQETHAMAAATLPGGRLQVWALAGSGYPHYLLYTSWKVGGPNSDWTPWQNFLEEVPLPEAQDRIQPPVGAALNRDGRVQVWAQGSRTYSSWKTSPRDPDAPWTDWTAV